MRLYMKALEGMHHGVQLSFNRQGVYLMERCQLAREETMFITALIYGPMPHSISGVT
jgi:hypothetical protein